LSVFTHLHSHGQPQLLNTTTTLYNYIYLLRNTLLSLAGTHSFFQARWPYIHHCHIKTNKNCLYARQPLPLNFLNQAGGGVLTGGNKSEGGGH